MSNSNNIESLLKNYIENSIVQGEATLEGDYKKVNKSAKYLIKVYKIMEENKPIAVEMLDVLMDDPHINVKIISSAHALGLNLYTDKAMQILEEIGQTDTTILGLNAEMCLKNYKDKGYLKFY